MSKEKAEKLNQQVLHSPAEDILELVVPEFGSKMQLASSMGAEDQVITHMISQLESGIEIFTLDTGRMFYETYELIQKTEARYGLKINIMFPDTDKVQKMVSKKGINLFYESIDNRKLCCGIRKIEPLQRALANLDAWATGLRREQSPTRAQMQPIEWDESNNLIKVNPLYSWTENQVWEYIHKNKIPYNTLHDKGFPSIGCQPCTRAIEPGEDIRNGRWWWENPETKECGLHTKK